MFKYRIEINDEYFERQACLETELEGTPELNDFLPIHLVGFDVILAARVLFVLNFLIIPGQDPQTPIVSVVINSREMDKLLHVASDFEDQNNIDTSSQFNMSED
ncbi:hypothetical protein COT97_01195 [Candidatus Falkowbacteria bacterium CG10_big_fil_rev_8_21_14_0_10_39_11]|uniref:Uncharacterized protein n=1 Tax=Candidatus Falkowbacteria bacterium CG10_big_fil_rev_8_21_14_0_10_39_11 TaxID=1974565 RepID=A0A2H0V5U0_9BACT|nr:MAG: hypothetical protein COT97_01195 [Candidatus Falkowbacteria bacterium CG10_big_fil_rev_8_21_14_0_10_39_11]